MASMPRCGKPALLWASSFVLLGALTTAAQAPPRPGWPGARTGIVVRGALVRLRPEASPSIVRVVAVPGDRVIVYRHQILVVAQESQSGYPLEGVSAGLLGSPQYAAYLNEPMRKPLALGSKQYFAVGDHDGRYFVDVIENDRIVEEVSDDHRTPRLQRWPSWLHQAVK
jgi:hypothetical protein